MKIGSPSRKLHGNKHKKKYSRIEKLLLFLESVKNELNQIGNRTRGRDTFPAKNYNYRIYNI